MSNERVRRPEPARTLPIRQWGTLFGVPFGAAAPEEAPDPGDPVAQGVGTGYRVIDDYLRRGQSAARTFWTPWGDPGATGGDPAAMMTRFATAWAEVASSWMMAMPGAAPPSADHVVGRAGPFTANAPTAPPFAPGVPLVPGAYVSSGGGASPARGPAASPVAAARVAEPRVAVEVSTRRRVFVSTDLRVTPGALVAHDLRLPGDGPRIGGVTVESMPDEGRVVVRLTVPDDAAPGTYVGAVIEAATGLPCGTVAVRIEA